MPRYLNFNKTQVLGRHQLTDVFQELLQIRRQIFWFTQFIILIEPFRRIHYIQLIAVCYSSRNILTVVSKETACIWGVKGTHLSLGCQDWGQWVAEVRNLNERICHSRFTNHGFQSWKEIIEDAHTNSAETSWFHLPGVYSHPLAAAKYWEDALWFGYQPALSLVLRLHHESSPVLCSFWKWSFSLFFNKVGGE